MHISEEKIRELQRRIQVTYEEAEKWLKKARGDINHAEHRFYEKQKSTGQKTKNGLNNIFSYRLFISRDDKTLVDLPIWMIFIVSLLVFTNSNNGVIYQFLIIFFLLITGCEIVIRQSEERGTVNFNHQKANNKDTRKKKTNDEYGKREAYQSTGNDQNYYEKEVGFKASSRENTYQKNERTTSSSNPNESEVIILPENMKATVPKQGEYTGAEPRNETEVKKQSSNDTHYEIVIED